MFRVNILAFLQTLVGLRDSRGTHATQLLDIVGGPDFDKVSDIETAVPQSSCRRWDWKAKRSRDDWWGVPLTAPSFRAHSRHRETAHRAAELLWRCMQVERLDALTQPSTVRQWKGRANAAFRVSGLYKRQTSNSQWQVGIKRAHFQPQTQVRALLCVSADAFVIRICVFRIAGDARGWGSKRMVLTHKRRCCCVFCVIGKPSEVAYGFLYIPRWWWFWTPACQRNVTNGRCVYWFAPNRVMPCAALRCTGERETEKWKSRENKSAFCLDKRLFYPPNGLIKCLFLLNEFSEGMSIWPFKQVHKGRVTCKHTVGINCLDDLNWQPRHVRVFLAISNVLRRFSSFMHRHLRVQGVQFIT